MCVEGGGGVNRGRRWSLLVRVRVRRLHFCFCLGMWLRELSLSLLRSLTEHSVKHHKKRGALCSTPRT